MCDLSNVWAHVESGAKYANDYGIWDFIQAAAIVGGGTFAWFAFIRPKKRIRHLNVQAHFTRKPAEATPLKVWIRIRNYTGRSVVLSRSYFCYRDLRASGSTGDSYSGEYEVKFPNEARTDITEVECLLRPDKKTHTWMGLDPSHTDDEVKAALKDKKVGELTLELYWIEEDKPRKERLRVPM